MPTPPLLLRSAQLRGNRLVVFDLLPWPLVSIDLCRRTRFAKDLATLIRRRVNLAVPASARSLGLCLARRGGCDKNPIDQKRPQPSTFRHSFFPLA